MEFCPLKLLEAKGRGSFQRAGFAADLALALLTFDPVKDPALVVLDFNEARVCDLSGLKAIKSLAERYKKIGKTLELRHLSPDCSRMLERARDLVRVTVAEDDSAYLIARIPGQPS